MGKSGVKAALQTEIGCGQLMDAVQQDQHFGGGAASRLTAMRVVVAVVVTRTCPAAPRKHRSRFVFGRDLRPDRRGRRRIFV